MKFTPWLEAAGLSMLYLLPLIAMFLSSSQSAFYHQVMPITSLTRGVLLDLLVMTLVIGAGLAWLVALDRPLIRRMLWIPVLFVTAWVAERGLSEFLRNASTSIRLPGWANDVPWILLAAAAVLLLAASRFYDHLIKAVEVFLLSAGFAAVVVVLPRLVYVCFNHAPPEHASFSHPVSQPWRPGQLRVIWVLFDELSYDQVFDHPQPGLHMPAWDRLKQESISFSHLTPVGNLTETVIPSLLLGRHVDAVTSNRRGELLWQSEPKTAWQHFQPEATLFANARRDGWSAGVVGWYNPYCRLLATTLDRCYWTYQEFANGSRFSRLSSEHSVLQNARNGLPLVPQIENVLQHRSPNESHKDDYRRVLLQAKSLIADQDIRFAFIHIPIPHPPGIYPDPLAGGREDYLGNLLLADQALEELRAAIAKTAASSDTLLIACSDHAWRVPMWRSAPGWTAAEEHASNEGQFDDRPVLLVHFPDQTAQDAVSSDRPQSGMILHSLLLDLLEGRVNNFQQFKNRVEASPDNGL